MGNQVNIQKLNMAITLTMPGVCSQALHDSLGYGINEVLRRMEDSDEYSYNRFNIHNERTSLTEEDKENRRWEAENSRYGSWYDSALVRQESIDHNI